MECVSTKPLPRNGRMMSGVGALLADSTVLAARPRATDSQVRAEANRIRMAAGATASRVGGKETGLGRAGGASQFLTLVGARKPVSSAIAVTAAMPSTVWIIAPPTWPASMLTRAIGMVRNRAMMPPVMSLAMETAVAVVAATAVRARMPGVMKVA